MGTLMSGAAQLSSAELHSSSSVLAMTLGTKVEGENGNLYRYVLAGGNPLVPGKLQQGPAVVANHQNVTCAVAVIGATSLTVTLGNTAATKDQYKDGTCVINDEDGQGHTYIIESHPAADADATLALKLKDAIVIATTTSSQAELMPNLYNKVIVNPQTPTNAPVGVAIHPVAASEYGFIQTRGPVACLNDSNTAVGLGIAPSQATTGAVKTMAATLHCIGSALQDGVSTEYNHVFLQLD